MSREVLDALGVSTTNHGACAGEWIPTGGAELSSENPTNGEPIAAVRLASTGDYEKVVTRAAEKRLLPTAKDTGTAVLVNRPFEGGSLFRRVKGRKLPEWAAELEATSWAQLFLKFILAHPAVTAPIAATSKPKHLSDNMGAGRGRLPTSDHLRRLAALF